MALSVTEALSNARRAEGSAINGPLAVGLTVAAAHLFAVPYTGCALNPARALGPAVLLREFGQLGLFWLGPMVGGLAAAVVHRLVNVHAEGGCGVGRVRDGYEVTPGGPEQAMKLTEKM